MTEQEIREAGAAAVADFPPMPDEAATHIGHLVGPLNKADNTRTAIRRDRAA